MDERPDSLPATDLLLAHAEFLSALSARLVASGADADDLQQETWLSALRHPPADAGAVRAWLAKVVRNHALQQHRSRRRRASREQWVAREESLPSTDEIVARENARRAVVDSLSELAEPYRSTLLLRFYEDLSPRDVAARMGVPVETVRTRLKRGTALLRESLDRRNGGDRSAWTSALLPLALGDLPRSAGGASTSLSPLVLPLALLSMLVAVLVWSTRTWFSAEAPPARPRVASAARPSADSVADTAASDSAPERGAVQKSYALRLVYDDDGAPVAGLAAQLFAPGSANDARSWISDAEGRAPAELELAPGDEIVLEASLTSRAATFTLAEEDLSSASVELRVGRASSARGRVLDAAAHPVPGAFVWAASPTSAWLDTSGARGPLAVCFADAAGEFELLELPETFYVHAQDGDRTLLRGAHIQSRRHAAHAELELRLEAGWRVSGRIVDGGGAALAGVRILTSTHDLRGGGRAAAESELSWRNLLRGEWASASDGRFEIRGLAPIAHNLAFELEGFGVAERRVTGPDWNEVIVLARAVELAFELRDASGAPLAGDIAVQCESGARAERSSADGKLTLFVDSTSCRGLVRARASGCATQWLALELGPGQRSSRTLIFEPERRVALRVVDQRGEPVAGANVVALGLLSRLPGEPIPPEVRDALLGIASVNAASDGRALLRGLPHESVGIEVSAPGFAKARLDGPPGASELQVVLERVELTAPRLELSARELRTGASVARCVVTARSEGASGLVSLVERFDGESALELPHTGLWTLYAHAPGFTPSIRRWREGEPQRIEFELAPERSVSVIVRDLRGAPVHPARLIVSDEHGAPLSSFISATYWANYIELPEHGELVVRGLPATRVRLAVRSAHLDGLEPVLVDLRDDSPARVVIEVPVDLSAPRMRAEFELPAGFPAPALSGESPARGRRANAVRLAVWDSAGVLCGRYRVEADDAGQPRFLQPWTMLILRFDGDGVLEAAGQQRIELDALFADFGPQLAPDSRRVSLLVPASGGSAALESGGERLFSATFAPPFDSPQRFEPVVR